MPSGLSFDHYGLAARDPEHAIRPLAYLGYTIGASIFDPEQNVNLIYCTHADMPAVEVISPAGDDGPLNSVLKQAAVNIYHLCFRCANIDEAAAAMKAGGLRVLPVARPKPAILFGGRRVAFFHVDGMGLVELLETALPAPAAGSA